MLLQTQYDEVRRRFAEFLKARGQRQTPERFAILDEVYGAGDHFDADALYARLRGKAVQVSRATVYNTLELLLECDLVVRHQFGGTQAKYERAYAYWQHDHLICVDCGAIREFCDPRLQEIQESVAGIYGFEVARHALTVYGHCLQEQCPHSPRRGGGGRKRPARVIPRPMPRTLLLSPTRVRRMLQRMAYEVVERNRGGDLVVLGIRQRGLGLAEQLAATLSEIAGHEVPAHPLDVSGYRDDRPADVAQPPRPSPLALEARDVLLVDDVLFTGRTARAGIDAVLAQGRPRTIQLAVLVDRGHREIPVHPDYVGRTIPTKHRERVVVEVGDEPAVYLEE